MEAKPGPAPTMGQFITMAIKQRTLISLLCLIAGLAFFGVTYLNGCSKGISPTPIPTTTSSSTTTTSITSSTSTSRSSTTTRTTTTVTTTTSQSFSWTTVLDDSTYVFSKIVSSQTRIIACGHESILDSTTDATVFVSCDLSGGDLYVTGEIGVPVRAGDNNHVYQTQSIDGTLLYACAGGNRTPSFMRSLDGGRTWEAYTANFGGGDIYTLNFINADVGAVASYNGVFTTSNRTSSPNNWLHYQIGGNIQAIYMFNNLPASLGVIAESNPAGKIVRTADNWTHTNEAYTDSDGVHALGFMSGNVGIAAGDNGLLAITTNSGDSWTRNRGPFGSTGINDLFCIWGSTEAWAIGGNKVFWTMDSGTTWSSQTLPNFSPDSGMSICWVNGTTWITTHNGKILHN